MRSLFIFLLFNLIIESSSAQSRWDWITRYPVGNYPDNSCQSEGRVFYMGWPKTFFYTTDAGSSFKVVTPYLPITDTHLSGEDRIAFADSLHGVIVDAEGAFKTTDGGKNWNNIFPTGSYFSLVAFGSKEVGWLCGGSGFYKTTDSGQTWNYLNNNGLYEISGNFSNIYALDENKIWICKDYNYDGSGICFSSDGGKNWITQKLNITTNTEIYYNDIKINKSGIGFAVGQIHVNPQLPDYIPFIIRTTDFGANWKTVSIDRIVNPKIIVSKGDKDWLILSTREHQSTFDTYAVELKSVDSGNTWEFKDNILNQSAYVYNAPTTAEYLESENILLVSGYDGIYRSLNFGDSFERLSDKKELWVEGFALDHYSSTDTQLAVAVSLGDSLIVSEDGGRSWQKKYISDIGPFSGSVATADENIFAAMNSGLYKSTDFGDSWIKIYDGYGGIRNISACSRNDVAFLSYSGYSLFLYCTKDGGDSWSRTPFFQFFCRDLQMVAPGKIYACGYYYDSTTSGGYLYKSEDFGRNWRVIDTKYEMQKIRAVGSTEALSISDYEVYRSNDYGNSWSVLMSSKDYSNYYSNFAFKDSLNGIMKISYELFESHNAGSTWTKSSLSLPLWGYLKFMEYNKFGDLLIIGDAGICININNSLPGKITESKSEVIENYQLIQNFPNPFNTRTKIRYAVGNPANRIGMQIITIKVYDILGKEITTLVNEEKEAGEYEVEFNSSSLSSGIYIYQLKSGNSILTKKMTYLK